MESSGEALATGLAPPAFSARPSMGLEFLRPARVQSVLMPRVKPGPPRCGPSTRGMALAFLASAKATAREFMDLPGQWVLRRLGSRPRGPVCLVPARVQSVLTRRVKPGPPRCGPSTREWPWRSWRQQRQRRGSSWNLPGQWVLRRFGSRPRARCVWFQHEFSRR